MSQYDTFTQTFHASGKLLLSGEYFVLDGALALAVPTKQGQRLLVEEQESFGHIVWESKDADGDTWFKGQFSKSDFEIFDATDEAIAKRLQQILSTVRLQNPDFLPHGAIVSTELEFPREWGLGTSSTLLYNIAQWANVDAYELLKNTFGGSGYDLACAGAESALFYRLKDGQASFFEFPFQPPFLENLYFVYLGKKQNSREGIARYREKVKEDTALVDKISLITEKLSQTSNLKAFNQLLLEHETIVAETLELSRAKDLYFADYWGEVKSLGAWGGDFVLVTSDRTADQTRSYFTEKGIDVFLPYNALIAK